MKPYYFSSSSQTQNAPFSMQFASAIGLYNDAIEAKRKLYSIFQTLKVRIPAFASNALLTYLPDEVKPLFRENGQQKSAIKFDYNEFIDALYAAKDRKQLNVFHTKKEAEAAVATVFEVLKERLSCAEYEDLMSLMPFVLRVNLLNEYVFDGHRQIV